MANEIQGNFGLKVANGYFQDQYSNSFSYTQYAVGRGGYVQTIGTSEEVVVTGDIAANGWCLLVNLDEDNYVEYGPESGGAMVAFGKLKPGEFAWFRLKPGVVLRAQADTADVQVDVRVYAEGVGY